MNLARGLTMLRLTAKVQASSSRTAYIGSRPFSSSIRACQEGESDGPKSSTPSSSSSSSSTTTTPSSDNAKQPPSSVQSQRDIWANLLQSVNRSAHNSNRPSISPFGNLREDSFGEKMSQNEIMEKLWLNRARFGADEPGKDWYGRIAFVQSNRGGVASALARLNNILRVNTVKTEFYRGQRWEKPTVRRSRLRRERHRRRFAAYINEKVQLVKYLQSRGS